METPNTAPPAHMRNTDPELSMSWRSDSFDLSGRMDSRSTSTTPIDKGASRKSLRRVSATLTAQHETYIVDRHLSIYNGFLVQVKSTSSDGYGRKFKIMLTFKSKDQLSDKCTWAVFTDYHSLKAIFAELEPLYPSVKKFIFPGKAFFHTSRVVALREKAFEEFSLILLRVYPVPKLVENLFKLNDTNTDYMRVLKTYPPWREPPTMRSIIQQLRLEQGIDAEEEFGYESDIERGTVEEEHRRAEYLAQKAKEQHTHDVVLGVGMIIGGLLFSMICQCVRHAGGVYAFYESLPELATSLVHSTRLYLNCLCWVGMVALPLNRALGWAIGHWLTSLLGEEYGPFHFQIDWVSLRLGLDHNELFISNLRWKNPSIFTKTPFFLNIKEVSLVFTLKSLIDAIRFNKALTIKSFVINELTVFIEKITPAEAIFSERNELNIWACLGAGPGHEESNSMRSSVTDMMIQTVKQTTSFTSSAISKLVLDPMLLMGSTMGKIGSTVGSSVGSIGNTMGSIATRGLSSNSRKSSRKSKVTNQEVGEGEGEGEGKESLKRSASNQVPEWDGNSSESDFDSSSDDSSDNEGDMHEPHRRSSIFQHESDDEEEDSWHWGVPFKLKCKRLTVRDVNLYAADFLQQNAERVTDSKKKKKVVINIIEMKNRELENTSRGSHHRTGLFLDELGWRLISKVVGQLLTTNALNLTLLAGTAALSQGAAVVNNTARLGVAKVKEAAHNYNPVKIIQGAMWAEPDVKLNQASDISVSILLRRYLSPHPNSHPNPNPTSNPNCIHSSQAMNISTLRIQVLSILQAKRFDNKYIKSASVRLELHNKDGPVRAAESQVRMGTEYFTVPIGEEFELQPVQSFQTKLVVKVLRKVFVGKRTCYCHSKIDLRDRSKVGLREWVESKVILTPGCIDAGLAPESNCNSDGVVHMRCMLT